MPWTFAHPAAILPLRRLPLLSRQPQALVLGAIAPDMARHVGLPQHGPWMHDWHAMLAWHWWVVALAAFLLGRAAPGLTAWWPARARAWGLRLLGAPQSGAGHRPLSDLAACALGALAGQATHIAWDSLTHAWGWPVLHWPALAEDLPGLGVPVYSGLQLGFSVLGVLCLMRVLGASFARVPPRQEAPAIAPPWRTLATAGAALAVSLAAVIWTLLPEAGSAGESDWAGRILISLADGVALSWVAISLGHGAWAALRRMGHVG